MCRTDFWTLWEKVRLGCFKRTAPKHVYYLGWNRSPAQVGCMAGALGRPRGIGWRGRWERGSGWGIHVNPWLIHVSVWQKTLQYCKVISLQKIYIKCFKNCKKKKKLCWLKGNHRKNLGCNLTFQNQSLSSRKPFVITSNKISHTCVHTHTNTHFYLAILLASWISHKLASE